MMSIGDGEDAIEEERRVLYVAMTRAKDELYITRTITTVHEYVSQVLSELNKRKEAQNDVVNALPEVVNVVPDKPDLYFLNELPPELVVDQIPEQTKNAILLKTYTGQVIADNEFGIDLS